MAPPPCICLWPGVQQQEGCGALLGPSCRTAADVSSLQSCEWPAGDGESTQQRLCLLKTRRCPPDGTPKDIPQTCELVFINNGTAIEARTQCVWSQLLRTGPQPVQVTTHHLGSTYLFYFVSREDGTWRELQYMGVEFKRASAASNVVWAIGGDHQVYVYVYGLEVAIRVKECVYENQRWNPVNGFSDQLLPTDRPQWSSVCGLRETTR